MSSWNGWPAAFKIHALLDSKLPPCVQRSDFVQCEVMGTKRWHLDPLLLMLQSAHVIQRTFGPKVTKILLEIGGTGPRRGQERVKLSCPTHGREGRAVGCEGPLEGWGAEGLHSG